MHGDHLDAAVFRDLGEARGVLVGIVPALAHLQRDRQLHRLHRRFQDPGGLGLVAHQRGAGIAVDHLLHRAAEIDVDDGGAAILVELGGLGHHMRLAAGKLHRHRRFLGHILGHAQRLAVLPDHRFAGDHLGHHQPGAAALDQAAERQVGDARHGRQDHGVLEFHRADLNAHFLITRFRCPKTEQCYRPAGRCCKAKKSFPSPMIESPANPGRSRFPGRT